MTRTPAFAALCAIGAVVVLGAGCAGHAPRPDLPPSASILHIAQADDVPTLDPAAGYDTVSWMFEQMIFDTLVRYSDSGIDLVPDLAATWESSGDATTFTFHLRGDARFTNGRPVVSDDFRFAIERVLNPATSSKGMEYYRSIAGAADFAAHRARHVRGIETPNPLTVSFRLTAPDPLFLHKLAMPFAAAVPREVVRGWGEDFSRHVVGSGPFKLREWIGGQRLVLVRNPDYFVKGRPRVDAIVDSIGASEELQWMRFEAGQIDLSGIPPAEFPYVMRTPALKKLTLTETTVTTNYLGMNCQMPPFTDPRVRRAFNYAVNKQKLVELLNGRGVVARGVLPPRLPGFDPSLKGYGYDPERARRLLSQAGVGHGLRPNIWMAADRTMMTMGESVQQDLALVGVEAALKPVAWGPLLEAIRQPKTAELFMLGWEADFPDPQNYLDVLFSKSQWGANNDTFYDNPAVDALLAKARPLTNLGERYKLYREAERIVIDDAPWVFLYNPVTYVIRQPWVHGYRLNPIRPARLDRVWLSPHGTAE
jgi:oligopeptide transport system substrate-binding protein